MFSIEEGAVGGSGGEQRVVVQFLDSDEKLHVARFGGETWFGDASVLGFGCWAAVRPGLRGDKRVLTRGGFRAGVAEGFQMTAAACCGRFRDEDGAWVEWNFGFEAHVTWGRAGEGRCTATWLSYLPVFEPGYQVLMADGVAGRGEVRIGGRVIGLGGARVYSEKNWGGSFPKQWWWVQANSFSEIPGLSVTAVGARRMIAGLYEEEIGMVAVHYEGEMFEFSNWSCQELRWRVAGWGKWEASARARTGHSVRLLAETADEGAMVLGPTVRGMEFNVRDAAYGRMVIDLWGPDGRPILDGARCDVAQVEVGGKVWRSDWVCDVKPLRQPLRGIINLGAGRVATTS